MVWLAGRRIALGSGPENRGATADIASKFGCISTTPTGLHTPFSGNFRRMPDATLRAATY